MSPYEKGEYSEAGRRRLREFVHGGLGDWGLEGGHEGFLEWLLKVVVTALRVGMSDTPRGPIQGQVLWGQPWDSGGGESGLSACPQKAAVFSSGEAVSFAALLPVVTGICGLGESATTSIVM